MQDSTVTVRVLEGHDHVLPEIRSQWADCLSKAPEHQQLYSFEWYATWFRHIAVGNTWTGDNRLLVAYDSHDNVVGILPLACRRYFFLRFWMLAGPYEPVRGFVCQTHLQQDICRAFARALVKNQRWLEVIRVSPIDISRPECALLMNEIGKATRRSLALRLPDNICARHLPASVDEFRSTTARTSPFKRNGQRLRQLAQLGEFRIVHQVNPVGPTLTATLDACRRVERNCWLAKKPDALRFHSSRNRRFWEEACAQSLSPNGQLDIWVAYFDDQPVAFDFSITTGSIRYLIAGHYDEAFAKYGLGWILYARNVENAITRGVRVLDMGFGDVRYKSKIGGQAENVNRELWIAIPGPIGYLIALLASREVVRRGLRSLANRIQQLTHYCMVLWPAFATG
jgi:CelD/BcsL family acetyltransferase involved in cellulose biosynthesis